MEVGAGADVEVVEEPSRAWLLVVRIVAGEAIIGEEFVEEGLPKIDCVDC
jgi:hypothetical protein